MISLSSAVLCDCSRSHMKMKALRWDGLNRVVSHFSDCDLLSAEVFFLAVWVSGRWDSFKALPLCPDLKETLSFCPHNKAVKRTNFIHLHPSGKARAAVLQTENEIWNQLWANEKKSMSLRDSLCHRSWTCLCCFQLHRKQTQSLEPKLAAVSTAKMGLVKSHHAYSRSLR